MKVGPRAERERLVNHARSIRRLIATWIFLVVLGSLQPHRPRFLASSTLHREIHWLAFAGTGFGLLLLVPNRGQELRRVLAAGLLGLSLEYLQHILYASPLEWGDVRDDCVATLAGFVLYRLASVHLLSFPALFCPWEPGRI